MDERADSAQRACRLEGTDLIVEPALGDGSIGLHASQWRDDPQAIADWEQWLASLEPLELTEQEQADLAAYEAEHRPFNVEAVRKQMSVGETLGPMVQQLASRTFDRRCAVSPAGRARRREDG